MTRKRFVKLCMANGYSRNAANRIAEKVSNEGKTYADAYKAAAAVTKLVVALTPALSEAVENFTKAVSKMARAFAEGAAAFTKSFQAAMAEE